MRPPNPAGPTHKADFFLSFFQPRAAAANPGMKLKSPGAPRSCSQQKRNCYPTLPPAQCAPPSRPRGALRVKRAQEWVVGDGGGAGVGWRAPRPGKLGSLSSPSSSQPTQEWRGRSDRKEPVGLRLRGWPGAGSGRGPQPPGRCSEAASCVARVGEGAVAPEPRRRVASQPIDPQGPERRKLRWTPGAGVSLQDQRENGGGAQGSGDRGMAAGRAQPEHGSACAAGAKDWGRVVTPRAPPPPLQILYCRYRGRLWPLPELNLAALKLGLSASTFPPHPHSRLQGRRTWSPSPFPPRPALLNPGRKR